MGSKSNINIHNPRDQKFYFEVISSHQLHIYCCPLPNKDNTELGFLLKITQKCIQDLESSFLIEVIADYHLMRSYILIGKINSKNTQLNLILLMAYDTMKTLVICATSNTTNNIDFLKCSYAYHSSKFLPVWIFA